MRSTTSGEIQHGGGRRIEFSVKTDISGTVQVIKSKFGMSTLNVIKSLNISFYKIQKGGGHFLEKKTNPCLRNGYWLEMLELNLVYSFTPSFAEIVSRKTPSKLRLIMCHSVSLEQS